jgi:PAS domain-containing protein
MARKSRAKLRESEERYRSIVEDGSELICRFDHEQKIVFANGAMSRLARMPVDGIIGSSFWSVLGDLDQDGSGTSATGGPAVQLGFEQLCDDVLPFEVAALQLPQTWLPWRSARLRAYSSSDVEQGCG